MIKKGISIDAPALTKECSLKTLVENRTVHTLSNCELNLFETYQTSALVPLKFTDLVITSMVRGKKIMHLYDKPGFDYLPGETVIVPSNVEMKIDFPEASQLNPTQCIALAIDHNKIKETLNFLNEKYPKEGKNNLWELHTHDTTLYNSEELASTINKLTTACLSSNITKDALADLALQELLIRLIQTQTVKSSEEGSLLPSQTALTHIITYIRSNINDKLNLKTLSGIACMSTASFYRSFKRELGMSPIDFVLHEKIKVAKQLLKDPRMKINEACYQAGFEDSNYFIRLFKKYEGITPKQYQQLYIN